MKLKKWEIGLLLAMTLLVLGCAMPIRQQAALADKLTRLHVVANSDSEEDQALKLKVRDAVLAEIRPEDGDISPALLERLEAAAQRTVKAEGEDQPVMVCRTKMYFDTRVYDTFSLPAGEYEAVRVVLGEGQGHNWWCVLFPPLCAGACQEDLEEIGTQAGLTEDDISYISGDGTAYVVRFKIAEWWGMFLEWFR